MKTLPAGLQDHLDSGTTTLCTCWRMTLKTGTRLSFTDHDCAVTFDGTEFEAASGFTGSEIESALGLAVDNLEASGALQSGRLDADGLRRGDFDHAEIEIWRVNWTAPEQRVLMRRGHLGEVTLNDGSFSAEVRGLAHLLDQSKGRIYQYGCDAVLGDGRCGVDLATPVFRRTSTVTAVGEATLTLGATGFSDGWLTQGRLCILDGAAAGAVLEIKRHQVRGGADHISLWQTLKVSPAVGEAVEVTAGCDRQFSTCRTKLANAVNFRGFPHMPGNDFVASVARANDPGNDGSKRD